MDFPTFFVDAKQLIEGALQATGMTLEELANRLDYKSLKRVMWGEIPLPDSKRKHIADIVRLHNLEKAPPTTIYVDAMDNLGGARGLLRQALERAGMSTGELAKRIGYKPAIVENVVNGSGRISEEMAEKIVMTLKPDLAVEDLLEGSETPRVMESTGLHGTVGARATVKLPGGGRTRIVPLISWAAAGALNNAGALDEGFSGEGVASTVPGRAFAVSINGDSMYPEINQGDYAVVRADQEARNGQVVLVRTIHGDVLCKRYSTRDGGKLVILSSVNKSYEPFEIPASEIAWIYPVKQVIRNYS